jgi:hypothetical protein
MMPTTRSARPVSKPVVERGARAKTLAFKKAPVKKAARKRPAKKSAKPTSRRALKRKRDAAVKKRAVKKRKQTLATNRVDVGPEPVAVDPQDEAARAAIAKRQVRGRRSAVHRLADPPPAIGLALVERVTTAVERELSQIEVIVGGSHVNRTQRTEAERRARTLASLARTLTEVRKLRAEEEKLKPPDEKLSQRDIEQFRLELARKLDRLVAEAKAIPPGETELPGDG